MHGGIERDFAASWKETKQFFAREAIRFPRIGWEPAENIPDYVPNCSVICELLEQLERQGFNSTLRAGHSVYNLVLSRSRGQLSEGPNLVFTFSKYGMKVNAFKIDNTEEESFFFDNIESNEILTQLLRLLELEDIDDSSGPRLKVAFAARDIKKDETISTEDFVVRSIKAELAPKDVFLAIIGAKTGTDIPRGAAISRKDVYDIVENHSTYEQR